MHYYQTSTNTPKVLRKEEVTVSPRFKQVYWMGIVLLAIIPCIAGVTEVAAAQQDF